MKRWKSDEMQQSNKFKSPKCEYQLSLCPLETHENLTWTAVEKALLYPLEYIRFCPLQMKDHLPSVMFKSHWLQTGCFLS